MEDIVMNTSNITNYKLKDFAELLGVSVKTLQRWDREGILKANRTPTNRRYYTYDQYLQFKGINTENDNRQIVIYARVSTRNQKDDLQNQVTFLRQFCNAKGIIVDQCIEDYGSGLNYNRKKWNQLLDEVTEQKIKTIIVTHKDRFVRFGYDWFEKGWLRDMAGYCVLFTPQAFAGPARPSMETTPAKYAKKALPSKGSREMRKAKMAYQAHWSEKEGIDTDV